MLKSSITSRRHRNFTEDEEQAKASQRAKTLKDLKGETFEVYHYSNVFFQVQSLFEYETIHILIARKSP